MSTNVPNLRTDSRPIDTLGPDTKKHNDLRDYLLERIRASERKMQGFYSRWEANERRVQAYIELPDAEKLLQEMNESGEPPKITAVTIPYSFATISTIVTFLMHAFCGRKPLFQVGSHKKETSEAALLVELVLQYNADHVRMVKHLYQYFWDAELYGVGIMRTQWQVDKQVRPVWKERPANYAGAMIPGPPEAYRASEERTVFEGTKVISIDPFMFFPDPRVPMEEVNTRGEFVFWRSYEGRHMLRREEAAGRVKWIDRITKTLPVTFYKGSARSAMPGGESHPGSIADLEGNAQVEDFVQIDQGTVEIIPRDRGLSDNTRTEKWIFTIANEDQIIQAEPFTNLHGKHPVAVIEPYSLGYGFGQAAISDYLGPIQDAMSWFINSQIFNVRAALNNMFLVDPSAIDMQDLKSPEPGKLIRLKTAAMGRDVRSIIHQFQVTDVTKGHTDNLQTFVKLGDMLSAVNENIRGQQA
ncbi:hypothetical protein LCGC14_2324130, partial [marine sediment metagenome]